MAPSTTAARATRLTLASLLLPLALSAQVPRPAAVFGFEPGADYKLADYSQMLAYYRRLDAASERVVVEEIGKTTLGKPMLLVLISSEDNIRNRARYKEISRRLAHAKGLNDEEARALAREGKAVVWIDGGLHASEVAHAQHTPEFAHWLATDEGEEARRVRDRVMLLLMPVMNPDGLDLVVEWYRKQLGTPFETAPLPVLYHHFIGHDNNRDWYMFTQAETRAVARQLYHEWFPQIVYNHHQSSPFPGRIWTPPFENPVNPNLDPLITTSLNQIGETIKKRFDEEGKPGAVSGIVFDLWWNGSMRGGPDFHNMLGFLTETALYRYATPHCYAAKEIPETFGERAGNLSATQPSTNYPNPWRGGCWRLRDAVEYMLTASRAVADIGADLKEDYLFNIYRMGRRQIGRGERAEGGPFAYVVDLGAQHDPGAAVELLRVFRLGGIEIRRAERAFRAGGREYAAGTYVIPPQAFRPFAVDLIEPKTYPDRRQYPGGPPEPPYDMTGYELSLQMGVEIDRVKEPFELPAAVVDSVRAPESSVTGRGNYGHLISHASNGAALATNRLIASGARVGWAMAPFDDAGTRWPEGTIVVRGGGTRVEAVARELGLHVRRIERAPPVEVRELRAPRIGLYKSWVASMDEGWIRWLLERNGFNPTNITDADVRKGDLARFDAILLPSQGGESIKRGHRAGEMPAEYVGGLGDPGSTALRRYVANGGWLIAIDEAIDFPIAELRLPVRNRVGTLQSKDFFIPGSLIRVQVDSTDPLAFGMRGKAITMFAGSQVMEVTATAGLAAGAPDVFARFAREGYLASGWAHGAAEHLAGHPAAIRVPMGRGQVVLLAFRPHFRGQPHNTFKMLFNPLHAATIRLDAKGGTPAGEA
ncbi:MAG: peptidase M14, partial [Gemmatimonadetes bacterium]|nr:peptidase M14 [Gemmatimonadota bacterium]